MTAPKSNFDSFRLEILSNALTAITEEIQLTILRTAYSHNVKEGRAMVAAARRHNRVVQMGTQQRSAPHYAEVARIISEVRDRVTVEMRPAGDPEDDRWRLYQAITGFLRNASAVFFFHQGRWRSQGKAVFNLNPREAIEHFTGQYERITDCPSPRATDSR